MYFVNPLLYTEYIYISICCLRIYLYNIMLVGALLCLALLCDGKGRDACMGERLSD